jgi:GntR family transcriptional regulator/MocR family aminotransferase
LGVNRNTIAAAYEELAEEGWVTARTGSGTFITTSLQQLAPPPPSRRRTQGSGLALGFDVPEIARSDRVDDPTEAGLLKWDFGSPDARLAPTRELARAYRRALRERGGELLHYERYRLERHSRLSVALAAMLRSTRGLDVRPERLVVTQGSQMAIYLVARSLIRPGDVVAVENPGPCSLFDVLTDAGATLLPIDVDAEGMRVDRLASHMQKTAIRAVLLTPHHQFPTTVVLSLTRRMELLELARRGRFAIIEDDYDHEFHYEGRPVLPLASSDEWGSVIYIGSLSKLFGPGLRVGYLVAPLPVVEAVRARRQLVDIQGDGVLDAAFAELFDEGEMQRHFNRARRVYAARRDFLVRILHSRLGGALDFRVPSGGMALWARVDPSIDVETWATRARGRGLIVRTGRVFATTNAPLPFLRLGFAKLTESELLTATKILASALPRCRSVS